MDRAIWVHQTNQQGEQTPADYAATLPPRGIKTLYLKALDGVTWMADVYSHPLAPSATNWSNLVQQFRAVGLTLVPWVVPRDGTPAEVTRHVTAGMATDGLIVDFEYHYPDFYRGSLQQAGAYFDQLRASGVPWLAVAPDPRQVGRDYSASLLGDLVVLPQTYWTYFQQPWRTVLEQAAAACGQIPGMLSLEPILPYNATSQDMAAALDWCQQHGLQAVSLWRMGTANAAQLDAFAAEAAPPAPPVPRRPLTLKGPGVDLDPLVAGADLDPKQLAALGFTWARLVERDTPQVRAYADALSAAGVTPVGVVTGETRGRILPNVRIKILGNEMDTGDTNPAKWPAGDAATYRQELDTYTGTYPDFDWLIGGLASGDPNAGYLRDVLAAGPLPACVVGLSMHPWNKNADEAKGWIEQVRAAAGDLPIILGEINRPASEVAGYVAMAQQECAAFGWYCLSDVQSLGSEGQRFGLFDEHGQPKDVLHALQAALGPAPQPAPPTPTPPAPTPDLKAWADALEQAAAYLRQQAA